MKRVLATFVVLLLFGLLSYDSALAGESRGWVLQAKKLCSERLDSGSGRDYEKIIGPDGTIVVCGKGEKEPYGARVGSEISATGADGQLCKPGIRHLAENLKKAADIPRGETIKMLIASLESALRRMQRTGNYDYATTDMIFLQIKEAAAHLDWSGEDSGWYYTGYGEIAHDAFSSLASIAYFHGKRYGMQIMPLLANLLNQGEIDQFDRASILKALAGTIQNTLFPYNKSAPESEKPTGAEILTLVETLLEFGRAYPEYLSYVYFTGEQLIVLESIAPHAAAELDELREINRALESGRGSI